jgi:hypothetical protein
MEKITAICGLNCTECEAYIATKENDDAKRKDIAEKWSKLYQAFVAPESINCVGCGVEGAHIGYCGMCEIRKCGFDKKVENCALCKVYPDCKTLNGFLKMAPAEGAEKIKKNLEEIRKSKNLY